MCGPVSLANFCRLSMAGLFNNVADTFRFVQFGQKFSDTFTERVLMFDTLKLRFLRWGNAVQIGAPHFDVHRLPQLTMICMVLHMQDTEWFSKKYQPQNGKLVRDTVLPPAYEQLHLELEDIALDRMPSDGFLLGKEVFVIDSPALFDAVFEALQFDLKRLETLFPIEDIIYRGMADFEVAEMNCDLVTLAFFRELARRTDKFLFDSLTTKIEKTERDNIAAHGLPDRPQTSQRV